MQVPRSVYQSRQRRMAHGKLRVRYQRFPIGSSDRQHSWLFVKRAENKKQNVIYKTVYRKSSNIAYIQT